MNNNNNFDKIEDWLNGNLSQEEAAKFEKEADANPELSAQIDQHLTAQDAIEVMIEDNLRDQMKNWSKEDNSSEEETTKVVSINKKKKGSTFRRLRPLLAAASVALLIGFVGMQWAGNYSNNSLLESSYSAYNMPGVRSGVDTSPVTEGIMAYGEKDYQKAIQSFQNTADANADYRVESLFYKGQSEYQIKNYEEAITSFNLVIASNSKRFKANAEWYKVLTYLAANQTDQDFSAALKNITNNSNHEFYNQAKELEGKMDSFWRGLVE